MSRTQKTREKRTAARARQRGWRQDPQGRRARVLEAAAQEFAREGFRGARLDRIAAAADVAEGTVYHQFGSKQGLLVSLGEQYGRGLAAAAFGDLGDEPSPEEIETIVRNVFGYVRETRGSLATFLLAHDPLEGGPAQDASRKEMLIAIEERVTRWISARGVVSAQASVATEIQFGLVETALRDCFLRHDGENVEAYIQEVTRCLRAYLAVYADAAR